MTYEVLRLDGEHQAVENAKDGKVGFKCDVDGEFYTYTDVSSGTLTTITDAENDEMFLVVWNGTTPIFKKRKMFPR